MYGKGLSLSLLFGALIVAPAAHGQYSYTYSYGSSRVVDQGQIGLPNPSSTYIGTGTLSKSAQGAVTGGPIANPGLPRVNHGGYIGTPGDNLYGANPITSTSLTPEQARVVQMQQYRANLLKQFQMQQMQQQQQVKKEEGNLYVPGQNLRQGSSGMMIYPNGNGSTTATYGSSTSTVDADPSHPASRHF